MLEDVYRRASSEGAEPSWFHLGFVAATGSFSESVRLAIELVIERRVVLRRQAGRLTTCWTLPAGEASKLHLVPQTFASVFTFLVYVSRRLEYCRAGEKS